MAVLEPGKMSPWERLFGSRRSAGVAKQRLHDVLAHDRAEIPPGMLALIKDDIVAVVSQRLNVDRDGVTVNVMLHDSRSQLCVNLPLLNSGPVRSPATPPSLAA
ncbi:MAG: cell division topological specificity factor MinE [Thermoflexales bacterium]